VVVVGAVEAVLLHDARRVAWAALGEAIPRGGGIVAVFYTYTGALGTGLILWVDITSFVLVVAGGQWQHLRVMLSKQITVPPTVVFVLGLVALLVLSCTSPWMGYWRRGSSRGGVLSRPQRGRFRPVLGTVGCA
jgi:hypothetical protein